MQKLSGLVEHLMESEMVLDGVLAQDATQAASLWKLRELIPEAGTKAGAAFKYDLSTAPGDMYDLVEKMRTRLREKGMLTDDGEGPIRYVAGFGHMGDGVLGAGVDEGVVDEIDIQETCTSMLSPKNSPTRFKV